FQISRQERQPLALALGNSGRREHAVIDLDLMVQMQALEVFLGPAIDVAVLEAEQVVEQIKISEHGRKKLPVLIAVLVIDADAVELDLACFGQIQAADDLGEG